MAKAKLNLLLRGCHPGVPLSWIHDSSRLEAGFPIRMASGMTGGCSRAIEQALQEKLERMTQNRLARECAKLDHELEKEVAEEGMGGRA